MHLSRFRGGQSLPLGEDVQQLGDEQPAAAGVRGDHIAVAENAALLKHRRLLQVLVRRNCQNTKDIKKRGVFGAKLST